jgi:hypothetical protein
MGALDSTTATLIGAVVGAMAAFGGNLIGNLILVYKDRDSRRDQRKDEAEKWQREQLVKWLPESVKLVNLYITTAIRYKDDAAKRQDDPNCQKASAEAQASLAALMMIYPNKRNDHYKELVHHLGLAMWEGTPPIPPVWKARELLVELAAQCARDVVSSPEKT